MDISSPIPRCLNVKMSLVINLQLAMFFDAAIKCHACFLAASSHLRSFLI
ncbi:MAG: hypothetical protein FWH29_08015 [Methanobrevibacter sp.]|nr:hypothetical protein [Methanobrevibacter sp.]